MKSILQVIFVLTALLNPLVSSAAEGPCSPLTPDLYSIIPQDWIVPGDYKVWNTDCGHYVFNYINRPEDATYHNSDGGNFFNYGFATNTVTELDTDQNNFTVAAQINGWSLVQSGSHNLFGAAIETVNTPEGDALTTMVATESQVNSRHSENHAPKVGIDTVLYTAHGDDDPGIGSDKYNVNSRAHFISATPSRKGEHNGWATLIPLMRNVSVGTTLLAQAVPKLRTFK